MDFYLETITPASAYPVTLNQAKDATYVPRTNPEHDDYLRLLIDTCTSEFERRTNWVTMSRVLRLHTTWFGNAIDLPAPPLISLDTIESREDTDDDWVAIDTDDYNVHTGRTPALVELDDTPVYTRIQYTCGYADADDVPSAWKHTILQLIVFYHENRGDVAAELPLALRGLLQSNHSGTYVGYYGFGLAERGP